jgi:MoaA/NifB/PqqE/SkfB family radical SAM enzyme/SAM-dependent methyltransferase
LTRPSLASRIDGFGPGRAQSGAGGDVKTLIKVGYGCNEHCTFCHTLDVRHVDGEAAEVHAKIRRAKRLGYTMVVLSGGEPTIRRELLEWAAHVAALDMDFGLVTNGQMLAYPELCERLRRRRLRYVYLSLHGGTADIHERIARAEGFARTCQAIANLAGLGLDFTVNAVVTRQNVDHLLPIVDRVLPYPDVVLKFSMVQPKGGGARHFDLVTPRVTEVAARVREAIAYGQARVAAAAAAGPRFAHDGIPFCLLHGCADLYDDLKTHAFASMVEIGEPDFFPVDDAAKVQPEGCRSCALRGPCPGLYRGYHDAFGADELAPVVGGCRSNSFDYVFEAEVPAVAGDAAACPILADGVTPWARDRHLFVSRGGRIARYRTETRDFADAEIEAVKHEVGQIYVDRSAKPAPDDFPADLRKLQRSAQCDPCPEKPRCGGLFEVVDEDVFSRDDARVRALLAELCGDVLDVGCGDGRYQDLWAAGVAAGRLRYLGIDPDPDRVALLARRWPWADLRVGRAEALGDVVDGAFDHVLCLRSWNHFADPDRALAALVRVMRPGATLTVVDNVAFGLVRSRAQAAVAHASGAGFEHYRNDDAATAAARVAALGLHLLERRDVTPATGNQWLLRYQVGGSSRGCGRAVPAGTFDQGPHSPREARTGPPASRSFGTSSARSFAAVRPRSEVPNEGRGGMKGTLRGSLPC